MTPCPCDAFAAALREGFLEKVGDDLALASRESYGAMRSVVYGPKIQFCPFCGGSLSKPGSLPKATVKR